MHIYIYILYYVFVYVLVYIYIINTLYLLGAGLRNSSDEEEIAHTSLTWALRDPMGTTTIAAYASMPDSAI